LGNSLLLVGHGSISEQAAEKVLTGYREHVALNTRYKVVEVGAILGEPNLENVIRKLHGSVTVLPVLMCNRHLARDKLREILDQDRKLEEQVSFDILAPVGEAAQFIKTLEDIVETAVARSGFDYKDTIVNLVAHGSKRRPASRLMTKHLEAEMVTRDRYRQISSSFLEEAPYFEEVTEKIKIPTVSIGLFVGGGTHALKDIKRVMNASPNKNHFYGGTVGDFPGFKDLLVEVAATVAVAVKGR
jgi:sirohydrochlorin ferrochelatase